jgi:CheY-like chemotaxis protein
VLDIAWNGLEAVEKFKANLYDIALMDVQMPKMDGYAATRQIRQIEEEEGRSPMLIIALTAHALKEDEQHSLDAGCNGHLTKPIKKKTLLEMLKHIKDNLGQKEMGL